MYKDVHFSSGTRNHTQAQMEVAEVRVVEEPKGTSGVIRIILPAATAKDAARTTIPVPAPFPHVPAHVV